MAKTIVITGAGDGLGRALARRFAKDGETVVLLGRTLAKVEAVAAELGAKAGGRHLAIQCDVGDPASVRAAFGKLAETHPKIDVLINNAGVFEPFSIRDFGDEQLLTMLRINFAGPVFCTREALGLMERGGHVINVTSESVRVKYPLLWGYEAAKAGLEHLSESIGRDLEADGIRTTVVRAGQMMDETKTASPWPPEVGMKFYQACMAVGINPPERPSSHYNSITDAFRVVIDSAADVNIPLLALSARRA